jgi:hypothetical protein
VGAQPSHDLDTGQSFSSWYSSSSSSRPYFRGQDLVGPNTLTGDLTGVTGFTLYKTIEDEDEDDFVPRPPGTFPARYPLWITFHLWRSSPIWSALGAPKVLSLLKTF